MILPAAQVAEVTVVFDAKVPPGDFPVASTYRGVRVLFALGDEDADSRIEYILERDSHPQDMTVVSSDRRIRQAATRRRARPLTADDFWDRKDRLTRPERPAIVAPAEPDRERRPTPTRRHSGSRRFARSSASPDSARLPPPRPRC